MDSEYLKKHLGGALTAALAEAVEKRPLDPIEFIAQYLYKLKENEAAEKAVSIFLLHEILFYYPNFKLYLFIFFIVPLCL